MRQSRVAFALVLAALLASFTVGATPAAAATSDLKIVIVVGPVGSSTTTFRSRGDAIYAEAVKYSRNVTRIYSPNATWAKVKPALQGASIVVYLGHGNGFPSPYRTTPWPYSQNGLGLNATVGNGDSNTQYYGEYYLGTEVVLAPNAVVLLQNLCYASGNSEPQNAEPTLSVAKQRVDNFGAGFIKAGARAVIADGHGFVGNYIRGLFTTHSTINDIWRSAPNAHGHTFSFASTRSTGFTALMDPDIASGGSYSGYYRSMVAKPSLTSDSVTGATAADTGTDPTDFTVPGNAAVVTPGAPLYAAPGDASAAATMPAGTRLRVLSAPTQTTATGGGILQVKGLDDSSLSGYAAKADLTPKDSVAPRIYSIDSVPAFSPNGDGRDDTYTLGARLSETADWQVTIRTGTTTLGSDSGRGSTVAATWNGLVGGNPVADGTYAYRLSVDDGWNAPTVMTGQLVVDTTAPALTGLTPGPDVITTFSPNGDTYRDTAAFAATSSEKGQFVARVRDTAGTLLRTMTVDAPSGQATIGWNGRNNAGAAVPDGQYTVSVVPRDAVGNTGAATNRTVRINTILGFTRASTILFFPQDLDRLNRTTTLSFTLTRPAKVTWTIHRGDVVVRTRYQAVDLPAGSYSWSFDGRGDDGVMLPRGRYRAVVDVTDSAGTVSQAATFDMDAFTIRASTTLARGKRVTFTVRSAETLRSNPRLTIYEPGLTSWGVTMSKVATKTYRVTITLKSGGSAGTMRLRASGFDYDGRYQRTTLPFALH